MNTQSAKATLIGLLIAGCPVTAMAEEISPLQKMATWFDRGSVPVIVSDFVKEELNLDLSSEADRRSLLLLMAANENITPSPILKESTVHSTFFEDDALMMSLHAKIGTDDELALMNLDAMVMGIAF